MRLFKNIRTHIWVSNVDNILWWWNYFEKISIFDTKVGCGWRCRSKTLGKFSIILYSPFSFINHTFLFDCFILQSKFSAFENKYEKSFNSDNFDYDNLAKSDYVFMRWKEHFLVRRDAQLNVAFSKWNENILNFFFLGSRSHDQRY